MSREIILGIFRYLVYISFVTPLLVFSDLPFPFVTSKSLYLRIIVELALPSYIYLVVVFKQYRPNLRSLPTIAVLIFFSVSLISAFTGVNIEKSLWGNFERMGGVYYLLHLSLMYFYILLLAQADYAYLRTLLKWVIAVAGLASFYGVIIALGFKLWFPDPSLPRISITFGNPIYVGSFLMLPLAFTIFFALQEVDWKKYMYWALAVLQLVVIYLSGTRGAVVGLIAGIFLVGVLYLTLNPNKKIKARGSLVLAAVMCICVLLFAFNDKLPHGTILRRIFSLNDSSRLAQWEIALSGYKDRPLFGTGSENYYIISNTYFNPEMYWFFDKPHNYILEILVTNGIFGLASYLTIIFFSFWGLVRAYKTGVLSHLELCFLLCGMVAYQIQNLFVFDSVSASLMFYIFVGFCGFLWSESQIENLEYKKLVPSISFDLIFGWSVFGVTLLVMFYIQYATNIMPARAMKATQYGYAYAAIDPKKAKKFFDETRQNPYNFDVGESASRFADFAIRAFQNPKLQSDPSFVLQCLNDSISYLEAEATKVDNYPSYWEKLAHVYITKAIAERSNFSPKGEVALQKAIDLAPKRTKAYSLMAQIRDLQRHFPEAIAAAKKVTELDPKNKDAQWHLALIYKDAGQEQDAYSLADKLLEEGYSFHSMREIRWMVVYYVKQKDFNKAIAIYEQAQKRKITGIPDYISLARIYAEAGDKQKALAVAQAVSNADANYKRPMDEFIKALGSSPSWP
jgi:O-antigen ligase/tetratricopeptide (TPR) repeat protein